MTATEAEKEKPGDIRYMPCVICDCRATCETDCLRYNVFVNQESLRLRRQNFLRFAEKINHRSGQRHMEKSH